MRTIAAFLIAAFGCAAVATPARGASTEPKSETTALRLSILGTLIPIAAGASFWVFDNPTSETYVTPGGTIILLGEEPDRSIPMALIGAGVMLGPSLGHFYAGRLGGLPLRILVAGATCGGAFLALAAAQGNADDLTERGVIAALAVLGVGCGIVLFSSAHDILTVKERIREGNRARDRVGISFAPVYNPATRAAGATVRIAF